MTKIEAKRLANIEKELLKIPDVDKSYLKSYIGNKSLNNVNKNALSNKVNKDRIIRNLRNQVNPSFFGKTRVKYIEPEKYEDTKRNIESKLTNKKSEDTLNKLSKNAKVSKEYVKAFASGKPFANISLNSLKNKRNRDVEVYKLDVANKKTLFGFQKRVDTKTMKLIPNSEYNNRFKKAANNLQKRQNNAAEEKRKREEEAERKKQNREEAKKKKKEEAERKKRNREEANRKRKEEANRQKKELEIEANRKKRNQNEANFNAAAELNKQLNIEANRQKRNKNEANFDAAAELNKQLKNEAKRQDRAKKKNTNNFNAAKAMNILNKQREGQAIRNKRANPKEENNFNAGKAIENLDLEAKKKNLLEKAKRNIRGIGGTIGLWKPAIERAKNMKTLNNLEKTLNDKVKLRNEIERTNAKKFRLGQKRMLVSSAIRLQNDMKETRNIFEKRLRVDELKKYLEGLPLPRGDKAKYIRSTDEPKANLNMIRASADKQVNTNAKAASKSLVADAIGKIQEKENKNIAKASKDLVSGAISKIKAEEGKYDKFKPQLIKMAENGGLGFMKKDIEAIKTAEDVKRVDNKIKEILKKRRNNPLYNDKTKNEKSLNNTLVKPRKNLMSGFKVYNVPTDNLKNMKSVPGTKKLSTPKPPTAPKPEKVAPRTLKNVVKKNKNKRVVESVKLAAKKTALSGATGAERVKLARNLAPRTQDDVKKVKNVVQLFNRRSAISAVNRLKKLPQKNKTIFKGRINRAKSKNEITKIQANAIKMNDNIQRKEKNKKISNNFRREMEKTRQMQKETRKAAELAAETAKKRLSEMNKMKAMVKENAKFNRKLNEKRRLLREKSKPKWKPEYDKRL